MNCNIVATPDFANQIKHLAKHYPSMRDDYAFFLAELRQNPMMGTQLGKNLRKVRFSIASKGKGKSGGARVITHTVIYYEVDSADITLLTIYDKSAQVSISDRELKALLRKNNLL